MSQFFKISICSLFMVLGLQSLLDAQEAISITTQNDSVFLSFHQQIVLRGRVSGTSDNINIRMHQNRVNGALTQLVTITYPNQSSFHFTGTIKGSDESIACASDPGDAGLRVVRNVVGPSHSLLNNAVYERKQDWLISFDAAAPRFSIESNAQFQYAVTYTGSELVIRFKPQYFKEHRGLSNFEPSTYSVWKKPVVGWCSWFAYFNQITEKDIHQTADVLSEKLKKYGLNYLQIDDGYQQEPIGFPDTWLQPNHKFPSGMGALSNYIHDKGLTPAIWTNVSFADSAAAFQQAGLFVKDAKGNPAKGNWIGYIMDGSQQQTLDQLISPVYAGFAKQGWSYFKLDALRHLKYEGYNSYADYFAKRSINRNLAYRKLVQNVRDQIGKNNFLLACWGIRPELVGLVDGCRIGNDGYSYAGLAQFNSYNNIIWRNDPDHIVLSKQEAYRSCVATSLTGSLFMLTDKPEKYKSSPLIDAAIRSIPVLYTQPGQVYDVDPSRSNLISGADLEMSGSGPRPFDASSSTTTGLFSLEISKPWENWLVLGRLDDRDKILPLRDLGLDDQKEYLVFEFWTKKLEGIHTKTFIPESIDTNYHCQVFCFREKQHHPQLLASNRHISCGALEIDSLEWKDQQLKGVSELVAEDVYTLYLYEPDNFHYQKLVLTGATLLENSAIKNVRKISFRAAKEVKAQWTVQYTK
jgi:alpha-galactosidase